MTQVKLPTGDYTIQGFEKILTIERKQSTSEFSQNILEARFDRELVRLEAFKYPFIILEFTMDDILDYPKGSGIPIRLWPKLRINSWKLLKTLMEYELKYKTKIILAGKNGKEVAASIFKRVVEREGTGQDSQTCSC